MFSLGPSAARIVGRSCGIRSLRTYPPRGDRNFRTITLLAVLTTLNLFDLAFTHSQLARGNFAEANVFAARVVDNGAGTGAVAYKLILFGLGAYILYHYRRRWQSEAGLWLLTGAYSLLMVWWTMYLNTVEVCLGDIAVTAPLVLY